MHRNKSVNVHQFAMVPRADIPRASFKMERAYKTTFDAGWLIPVLCEEVLPGDSFNVHMTAFARLATPIFPLMDNLMLDSFFFFVPNRLVWTNWQRFMGERDPDPDSSTDFVIPKVEDTGGWPIGGIGDYFGLPTAGQFGVSNPLKHSALPLRGYQLICNEWFRDENLIDSYLFDKTDGPNQKTDFALHRRGKRHDYFTGCLPWPQKGPSVPLALGMSAPVVPDGTSVSPTFNVATGVSGLSYGASATQYVSFNANQPSTGAATWNDPGLIADLSAATAATINQLRQSFQIQKLLERDARGGTRYTEIVRAHFGVVSPDARLQRPEYLGGGSTPVTLHPIAQTSGTAADAGGYTDTPLGNLAAMGTVLANHGFSQAFTEHGYIIGLVNVRADLTYQQGLRRHWSRSTRYDFYWPAFAMLGEQAVLSKEIYATGAAEDDDVFGYQERWAEYRYSPSEITGLFRSTAAGTIDGWHLSQRFTTRPVLGQTFIEENPPMDRVLAVGAAADGQHFLFDSFFSMKVARPMPLYSVPGLIDHF